MKKRTSFFHLLLINIRYFSGEEDIHFFLPHENSEYHHGCFLPVPTIKRMKEETASFPDKLERICKETV